MILAKEFITADDLERIPEDDLVQMELDEGKLITMPPAGGEHCSRETTIAILLGSFVRKHRLGKVYTGDAGFRLNKTTVRGPDVAFIRADRARLVHSDSFINGAPDLAIEIFSPFDNTRRIMRKAKQYFAAGCQAVWIVYPRRCEIQVLKADGTDVLLRGDDLIESPELLPGFSVPVSEFFQD